jgi:uncharacterized protein
MRLPAAKSLAAVFLLLMVTGQLFSASGAYAEEISKITPAGYVTDLAGTINATTKNSLEAMCTELEQKTGAQIAIVTVHDFQDQNVEYYAADLYKHLGIGNKKDDRGVLLLISPDQRKYRIEVGYGLEPVINDARAGDIGRSMVPYLRANDYDSAIQSAAWQLAKYIADDRGVTLSGEPQLSAARPTDDSVSPIFVWGFLIVVVVFFLLVSRGARRGGSGSGCLWFLLGMLVNSGGGGGYRGGGGFGGGGGGGGFGGFGGGSSGGGGASGSW